MAGTVSGGLGDSSAPILFPSTIGPAWINSQNATTLQTSGITLTRHDEHWTVADLLWIYLGPVIYMTGFCGNSLILIVMRQASMRGTSTCVYLQTMAIADLFAITTGVIPDWLTARNIITLKEVHPLLCKFEKFLFYTSSDTSVWVCVVFTVDRFVAVCFPMENMQRCPPHHAKYYSIITFIIAIGKNFHVLVTRGQERKTEGITMILVSNCGSPTEAYKNFETFVRPWMAFTVVNLLPFCIIVFCNLFIVREMIRLRHSHRQSAIISIKDSNNVIQMTALCLSASICFLVCVTPSMILLIGKPYWTVTPNPRYDIAKAAGNLIFYVNHSINFFLYCMTGKKFRRALASLLIRGAAPLSRLSTPRNSVELVFAYRLKREHLENGKSGLYASAPCIALNGLYKLPALAEAQQLWRQRTYLQNPRELRRETTSGGCITRKAASDGELLNYVGTQSEGSLLRKESRI